MIEQAHTTSADDVHRLAGSSAPTGAAPTFEAVAAQPLPCKRPEAAHREFGQATLIKHANRVAHTARDEQAAADRRGALEDQVFAYSQQHQPQRKDSRPGAWIPERSSKFLRTALSRGTHNTDTQTEALRSRIAAVETYEREEASFVATIGLPEAKKQADYLSRQLELQSRALTKMKACSLTALAAKAGAWIETQVSGSRNDWDDDLMMSVAQDAARIGMHRREPKSLNAVNDPDRRALEAYAEWLYMERRLLAIELYPELGKDAVRFVPQGTAAATFHFPVGRDWRSEAQPSSRAEQIMDLLGIDWRAENPGKSARRRHIAHAAADGMVPVVGKVA